MKHGCLITGASGGIGKEFARVFAAEGHDLILVARSSDKLETLCAQLERTYGVEAVSFCADLSCHAEIRRLYDWTAEQDWQVDCLVNNAGFGDMSAFLDALWPRQQALIDLNISAVVRLTYLFGRDMKKRGSGRILNLASVAAFSAGPYMSLYYASKSFVLSFSEALARELKGSGVTVTALCPGPTATGFEKNANMGKSVMFSRFRPATAAQVAKAGYRAVMKGRSIKYHGFVTGSFQLLARALPRSLTRRMAEGMNRRRPEEEREIES